MKSLGILAAVPLLAAISLTAAAQSGTCATPPTLQLSPASLLTIHSRSSEIDITGSDQQGIRITCTLDHPDDLRNVKLSLSQKGITNLLRITGGPQNNLRIRIEVPTRTDLQVHLPAGELKLSHITGNKDLHLTAGEITVNSITKEDYESVRASTRIGEVNVPGRGVSKGGFFNSFTENSGLGKYHLTAHLTVGEINLN